MQEERLIELVKQNRFLYDKNQKDFRKHLKNDKKWKEIATELGVSVDVVKKRWRTIKDRYIRIQKQRASMKTGKAIKYKFFKMLSFLDDCNASCESPSGDCNYESTVSSFEGFHDEYVECELPKTQRHRNKRPSTSLSNVSPTSSKDIPKSQTCSLINEDVLTNTNNELVLSLLKGFKEDPQPKTKERGFCESLALQLEEAKLPSRNFRNFQMKVLQLLNEEISVIEAKTENVK